MSRTFYRVMSLWAVLVTSSGLAGDVIHHSAWRWFTAAALVVCCYAFVRTWFARAPE